MRDFVWFADVRMDCTPGWPRSAFAVFFCVFWENKRLKIGNLIVPSGPGEAAESRYKTHFLAGVWLFLEGPLLFFSSISDGPLFSMLFLDAAH